MPETRHATEADVPSLIELKGRATADWGMGPIEPGSDRYRQQERAIGHLLATGSVLVSTEDGRATGFGASIVREDVWFLSQLFVSPDVQSAGSGAAILDALMDAGRGERVRCTLSSDDARAIGLYLSRGMLPGWIMIEFLRHKPAAEHAAPPATEAITPEDQPALDALDRLNRGFARTVDHDYFREISEGHAIRRDGALVAYAYVQPGGRVSPLAAADDAALLGMVDAADALAGTEASWSVPSSSPVIVRRLLQLGYRPRHLTTFCTDGPVGPFDRMSLTGGLLL